jgi:hypothetical protein
VIGKIDKLVPLRFRAAALMPAAILTVHQLRFQLAFGANADSRLAREGHQYLAGLAPVAAMCVAIGVGLFLASLARAWQQGAAERGRAQLPALPRLWALAALALLAIYCGQELAEGFLSSGHPGGLAGVFGEGGLWSLPLSVLLGGVVALCLRGSEAAVRWLAEHRPDPGRRRPPRQLGLRPLAAFLAPRQPLANAAAGRAPPPLLSPHR